MCRLVLMNRQAVDFLDPYLLYLFGHLECALGGDGNGVGALWIDKQTTRIRKGVNYSPEQTAKSMRLYSSRGADWLLFHTRRATSSAVIDQHCHPFRRGNFVLAHNGHDSFWAQVGRSLGCTDSESIAQAWSRVRFPLSALSTCSGVFVGFSQNHPFVVKGQSYSDLAVAWHKSSGAILFASELPSWLAEGFFDEVLSLDRIQWFGRELDPANLEARPYELYRPRTSSLGSWQRYSSPYDDLDLMEWTGGMAKENDLPEDGIDIDDGDDVANQKQVETSFRRQYNAR